MSRPLEILKQLQQLEMISDLDRHFAALMCRLEDAGGSELLAVVAALTCNRTAAGDVCLDINAVNLPDLAGVPARKQWPQRLRGSSVIGTPGEFKPLVLDRQGRCYLYRYWDYEQRLGNWLLRQSEKSVVKVDEECLTNGIKSYFSNSTDKLPDWQKVASATALMRSMCVISGGPGTGKTTTVVKILALLVEQAAGGRVPTIVLAAPTGKAAARLQESIGTIKQKLDLTDEVRDLIPEEAQTLHRLLGYIPGSTRFRYNREKRLPVDVLILDEASMVDMALMVKTVEALPDCARLILLGDKDQLASVESGAVLGDICGAIPGFTANFARDVAQITGELVEDLQGVGVGSSSLGDSLVELQFSYRFGSEGGIGRLADAVNRGDSQQSLHILRHDPSGELYRINDRVKLIVRAVEGYGDYLKRLDGGAEPEEVIGAFERFQVLCAMRVGPAGVMTLNREIEKALTAAGLIVETGEAWYPGRPVLITRNDHGLRLYNGDIGILMPDDNGELKVAFSKTDGRIRWLAPSRIPEHESAYCLTVHKSQGSEFDQVLLMMPDLDSPVLSRQLLYTAITRSRERFEIFVTDKIIEKTVAREINRMSGLKNFAMEC